MPKDSLAAQALTAYAQGVNADIAQVRASGQWPAAFSLPGVYPGPWTPVDSLVIQGELTQELAFTSTPLDYALLERSLGAARTMDWFGVIAKNAQTPYDPGPYAKLRADPARAGSGEHHDQPAHRGGYRDDGEQPGSFGPNRRPKPTAAGTLLAQLSQLPSGHLHEYPDSNAWAANGPAVAGGEALLAGDPHLPQTIPSVWYEAALSAPGFDAAGVSVPGLPGILIGHNARIAWSLTDTQNQATLFYAEKTRPGQYYWRGAWRPMQVVHYTIPVPRRRDQAADRGHHRARADHDPGRADHLGRLDGQRALARPGGDARRRPGRQLQPVQGRPGRLVRADPELRLRRRGREHRRDLGGLLSPGRRRK